MMMCWRWQWRRELFHPRWRGPETSGVEGRRESEMVVNALSYRSIEGIQRYPSLCAPSLVKFVPAIARLFCLSLPGSLTIFCAELRRPPHTHIFTKIGVGVGNGPYTGVRPKAVMKANTPALRSMTSDYHVLHLLHIA